MTKRIKKDLYKYPDPVYEEAEVRANKFNLIFLVALIILSFVVIALDVIGLFSIDLSFLLPIALIAVLFFLSPIIVYLIHDKALKKEPSILKMWRFKYVIYVPCYFGLLILDVLFSYHAVLLIVIPPLMAAQYRYIKRDWFTILFTTIATIPIVVYGNYLFGFFDRNLIKDLTSEEAAVFANRLSSLDWQRVFDLFFHHILPRVLAIAAIDFLIAAIVQRNSLMLARQADLSKKVSESIEKSNALQSAVIDELASVIETRDIGTGEHVKRTKEYVRLICEELAKNSKYADKLSKEEIDRIVSAASLHDIGKIAVSDLILLKPGKLNKEEFEAMKIHAVKGGEMVKEFFKHFDDKSFFEEAYSIAMYHHEKWDGTGYPEQLSGEMIPLPARIMAVADVYDALVSKRVYKEPIPAEEAFEIIVKEKGHHFDPDIIDALVSIKDEFIASSSN